MPVTNYLPLMSGRGGTLRRSTGPCGPCRSDAVWSRSRC